LAQTLPLIPFPADVKTTGAGVFVFTPETKITLKTSNADVKKACDFFLDLLNTSAGLNIGYAASASSAVIVELDAKIAHPEGYQLKVTPKEVIIKAQTPSGVFFALQTVRQLLPPEIENRSAVTGITWSLPEIEINDAPRFPYRGMMLDVTRHFFTVADIKRFIDLMTPYKFNHLQLHLADDQGWRIEIKRYPKLQTISAWRKETLIGHLDNLPHKFDGISHGGYYTQEELKDIVKYAADRFITIVPDINMPGHATAILAAYPEFACIDSTFETSPLWGIFPDVMCPSEETFKFLENIIDEIVDIFPGKYIHIGGDECPTAQWKRSDLCKELMEQNGYDEYIQLQTWFMRRMVKYVNSKGRQAIGWDEIIDGGDIEGATIMSWRGEQGGINAARKGNNVIMTPHRYSYIDYYQWRERDKEPLAQGGYLPLSMVYQYDPVPKGLTDDQKKYILGSQGNLFTEYIADWAYVEYMTFPRECAIAERTWTPLDKKSYNEFLTRLRQYSKRLDIMKVNYAKHML
jgi:hexosaminidase